MGVTKMMTMRNIDGEKGVLKQGSEYLDMDEGNWSSPFKDPRHVIDTVKFEEHHRRKLADHVRKRLGILS